MTEPTIRRVEGQEMLDTLFPLTTYAFHSTPPIRDKDEWDEIVRAREGVICFAAYEDGDAVATVASTPMTQNVRGAVLGMRGIWGVATHPASRRRGHCRALMARQFAAMRADGAALSGLYPFRESFYERLGYTTLPQIRQCTFSPLTLSSLASADLDGDVDLALFGDRVDAYLDYVGQMQRDTHGMSLFLHPDRLAAGRVNSWLALAKAGGETVGMMVYNLRGERETEFKLRAIRFYYRNSHGRYLLLQWIARHIDQANEVELWLAPYERPETWLADMKVKIATDYFTPMGRVVDVAGLTGMHVGPGSFTARISDPLCPWNEGAWRFGSVDGRLEVSPAPGSASCVLHIQAVSGLVYGTHEPDSFRWRGWGDVPTDVQATLRAMFPPKLPHMHEVF